MQMRRAQLPENSHRQRLAAPGITTALRRLFFSVSRAEDRGRARRFRADELIHGRRASPYRRLERVKTRQASSVQRQKVKERFPRFARDDSAIYISTDNAPI